MTKPQVHVTDVNQFLTCRTKWFYSSQLSHGLRARKPNKHLVLGTAVHYALGAYYGAGSTLAEWDGEGALEAYDMHVLREREAGLDVDDEMEEYLELGRVMLREYIPFSEQHDNFTVIMPEVALNLSFGSFDFVGTTDGLVRDEQGDIWLLEHKTASQFPNSTALAFSMQSAMYCYVAQRMKTINQLGHVKGVIFNILRKAVPAVPKLLKSGDGLERRKDIGCTPTQYLRAVKLAGFNPNDYVDFAAALDPYKFVHREYISLPDVALEVAVTEFKSIVKEMLNPHRGVYRCDPLRQCSWCDYRSLCSQRLFGRDWQEIADYDFVRENKFDEFLDTD